MLVAAIRYHLSCSRIVVYQPEPPGAWLVHILLLRMLRLMAYNEKANSNKANVLNHHSATYVSQNERSFPTNNTITMNADSTVPIENQG